MSAALAFAEPFQPTARDVAAAREARRMLASWTEQDGAVQLQAVGASGVRGQLALLPQSVVRVLLDALGQIADGNAVSVVPVRAALTTPQAAAILDVPHPFLVALLEKGALPFSGFGVGRRVRLDDLLAYKRREHEARHRALDELARQGQELELGY